MLAGPIYDNFAIGGRSASPRSSMPQSSDRRHISRRSRSASGCHPVVFSFLHGFRSVPVTSASTDLSEKTDATRVERSRSATSSLSQQDAKRIAALPKGKLRSATTLSPSVLFGRVQGSGGLGPCRGVQASPTDPHPHSERGRSAATETSRPREEVEMLGAGLMRSCSPTTGHRGCRWNVDQGCGRSDANLVAAAKRSLSIGKRDVKNPRLWT